MKRTVLAPQDLERFDIEKYFEFFDLSLRQYYTDVVNAMLHPRNIEGRILDVGCGFGILGMMICSHDEFATVIGLEPSRVLVRASEVITSRRGYSGRITFKVWEGDELPFDDAEFDAVVSFISMHKWANPEKVLTEIERVRKKGSIVYISDFRRDRPAINRQLFLQQTRIEMGKDIANDLRNSFKASYTAAELRQILDRVNLPDYHLDETKLWLNISTLRPEAVEETKIVESDQPKPRP